MSQEKRNNWITKKDKNGKETKYYRLSRVVGHKKNEYGNTIPICKQFTARTKKAAEQKYADFLDQQKKGIKDNTRNFGIEADNWIENTFKASSKLKDSSKIQYIRSWNNYMKPQAMYNLDLKDIDHDVIQATYNSMVKAGVPYSSIEYIHRLMKKLYAHFEKAGYSSDASRLVEVPSNDNIISEDEDSEEITIWNDEEIKVILNSFEKADNRFRLRFFIFVAYYTGCRVSEILALKYSDISNNAIRVNKQIGEIIDDDSEADNLIVGKGLTRPKSKKSIRTIPMNHILQEELKNHIEWHKEEQGENLDFIFTTKSGKRYDRKNVTTALERYYEKINVEPKSVHTYRHTFGTNLCKSGVPIQVASKLLGHDSIDTTMRYYVNVSQEEMFDAVEKLVPKE